MSFAAVAATVLLTGVCHAETVRDSKTAFAAQALDKYVKSGEIPGIISVFYQRGVQETACLGYADAAKKIPITMDKTFMQCSQTKGFCGVTIAILVEEGKLSLDDPVSKYLPEFKSLKVKDKKSGSVPAKNILTIRHVMNHTGGFPFEIPSKTKKGWSSLSLRDTAREAASLALEFEPGTAAKYSNTGIDIGAAVIEVVTGKPWEVFLKERVLDPLGMKDTTFWPTDEMLARSILLYDVKPGKVAKFRAFSPWMPLPHNGPTVYPSAGAGLWTTANDQLKFYKMLMNLGIGDNGVRIMKEETVKNLLAASSRPAKLGKYSLGLNVDGKGGFGHGGAWGTRCTVNWKNKQLQLKVVQIIGKSSHWNKELNRAAGKFFTGKFDTSGSDAYTGRLK